MNNISEIDSDFITTVKGCVVFNLYKERNEWVNWNGDTDKIRRSGSIVLLSLDEAEQEAEKLRNHGTKFIIDEVPAVLVKSRSECLVITELFSALPLSSGFQFLASKDSALKMNDLKNIVLKSKWGICDIHQPRRKIYPLQDSYYQRISSAGKGKNHMGWSLKPSMMNHRFIQKIVCELDQNILD